MDMTRRGILEITKEILKLLKKEKALSVKSIARRIESQWETAIKSLGFLVDIGLVVEKKGKKTFKEERLFSLK